MCYHICYAIVLIHISNTFSENLPKSLQLAPGRCWGYEADCEKAARVSAVRCDPGAQGWRVERDPVELFYKQGDFGYLRSKLSSVRPVCRARASSSSSLVCSQHLEFCTATNIALNFTGLSERVGRENLKYRMDIFGPGKVELADCDLDTDWIDANLDYMSPLQSWAPELQHVQTTDRINSSCDLWIEEPTMVVKLDATTNMYHHFCDFFNLYLSQHLNYSLSGLEPGVWATDKQVLLMENLPYRSAFSPAWSAFTSRPLLGLAELAGRTVCLRRAVFPLPPRGVFGLYYNTPLVGGCHNSAMFRSFSSFLLERLGVPTPARPANRRIHVTFLSRNSARYRRVTNEAELAAALRQTGLFTVTVAEFGPRMPLLEQLRQVAATDILVGIHGAGLTHSLFLPDWAEVFELYNCEDAGCYRDLAALRGLGYTTHSWGAGGELLTSIPVPGGNTGPAHRKFANYEFDTEEFVRVLLTIRERLLSKPEFLREAQTTRNEL